MEQFRGCLKKRTPTITYYEAINMLHKYMDISQLPEESQVVVNEISKLYRDYRLTIEIKYICHEKIQNLQTKGTLTDGEKTTLEYITDYVETLTQQRDEKYAALTDYAGKNRDLYISLGAMAVDHWKNEQIKPLLEKVRARNQQIIDEANQTKEEKKPHFLSGLFK